MNNFQKLFFSIFAIALCIKLSIISLELENDTPKRNYYEKTYPNNFPKTNTLSPENIDSQKKLEQTIEIDENKDNEVTKKAQEILELLRQDSENITYAAFQEQHEKENKLRTELGNDILNILDKNFPNLSLNESFQIHELKSTIKESNITKIITNGYMNKVYATIKLPNNDSTGDKKYFLKYGSGLWPNMAEFGFTTHPITAEITTGFLVRHAFLTHAVKLYKEEKLDANAISEKLKHFNSLICTFLHTVNLDDNPARPIPAVMSHFLESTQSLNDFARAQYKYFNKDENQTPEPKAWKILLENSPAPDESSFCQHSPKVKIENALNYFKAADALCLTGVKYTDIHGGNVLVNKENQSGIFIIDFGYSETDPQENGKYNINYMNGYMMCHMIFSYFFATNKDMNKVLKDCQNQLKLENDKLGENKFPAEQLVLIEQLLTGSNLNITINTTEQDIAHAISVLTKMLEQIQQNHENQQPSNNEIL